MTTGLTLSLDECLSTFLVNPRPYQRDSIKELVNGLAKGNDVATCLPTGTGKTYVYLPAAIVAANHGHRVCIIVATNLIIDQLERKYLPNFKVKTKPHVVKGIEHYDCLLTGNKADYGTCNKKQKSECSKERPECTVLNITKEFEEYPFILTNFHKFLSTPTERGFDLIIIDDSHGFENALDDKFQNRLAYYQINDLFKRHELKNDAIADFTGFFLDYFDDALRAIPPDQLNRRMPDDVIKGIAEIEGFDQLQNQLKNIGEADRDIVFDMLYFANCCKNTSYNTFYIQKDYYNQNDPQEAALIARKSDSFQNNVVKKLFGKSKVVFASATPGDIITHASYCTHRKYTDDSISIIPKSVPPQVENWFNGLQILETRDFPKDSSDSIEKSAEIAAEILKRGKGKTLLLFKSYRDQRKAENTLKKIVTREITFIDDSYQTEKVQQCVEKADIIMATASSRLWEGIDISDLKLEIIFSLPFIRPPVHLEPRDSFPFVRRKMLIRLQQGIGRLIRKENDTGVCIILDNRLEKYKKSAHFSEAYRKRIIALNIEDLLSEFEKAQRGNN